jgi:isopenicillin-N epimerase
MAPKGTALLHVRREVQERIRPLVVSWGWESDHPGESRFVDHHEWTGTNDFTGYLSIPAAIDFFEAHDWRTVRQGCRELMLETRERLLSIIGLPALCPADPWLLQMCAVPLPERIDGPALHEKLRNRHNVEVPVTEFAGRYWLRFSIQGYNDRTDADRLVSALAEEL